MIIYNILFRLVSVDCNIINYFNLLNERSIRRDVMLSLESEKTWNTEVNIVWAHLSSALGWGVQSQRLVSSYN